MDALSANSSIMSAAAVWMIVTFTVLLGLLTIAIALLVQIFRFLGTNIRVMTKYERKYLSDERPPVIDHKNGVPPPNYPF